MYYFKKVVNGLIISVETKSVKVASPGFVKATKIEVEKHLATLPPPVEVPTRDFAAEIDEIKAKLTKANIL